MGFIRIAQAQVNVIVGDFVSNTRKIIEFIEDARNQHADIVTFPELAVCGYPPEDLLFKSRFIRENLKAIETIKEHTRDITTIVGYAASDDDRIYSSAAVIMNQRPLSTYHKIELPNYGVFDEKRYFARGNRGLILLSGTNRLTVNICEDIWVKGGIPQRFVSANSIGIVLNISALPFHVNKISERMEVARQFAMGTKSYVCLNNLVGGQDELVFDGGSFIIGPDGDIISRANRFQEELLVTDIPEYSVTDVFEAQPDDIFKETLALDIPRHDREQRFPTVASEISALCEVYEALVLGTRDYVIKNGFQKVVIGLSGGIDSSLTAVIAADALGSDNVVGVTMPSIYTSNETFSDAALFANRLGIKLFTIPIKELHSSYINVLKDIVGSKGRGFVYENIQARIRGNLLMALSNHFGWLVLTTGNKSELAVGYCTLYGDMAGGFATIKDVPKTMVFELADYVNTIHEQEIIPQSIIKRPPSAELRPDQKDEDSLPPYSILDGILHAYVEEDKAVDEIINSGYDPETVNKVVRMVDLNEYKRRQAPPGVRISPKAFGKDRRFPITNRYRETFA